MAGLSFLLFLVHQVRYVQNITLLVQPADRHLFWMHLIAETLMFGLGLFFVVRLVTTLLSERQAKKQLAMAHEQLRQYALQIEELAAVQERNHIAREIHDSLGHTLTAQNIQLQTAIKLWQSDPGKVRPFLEQALRLANAAIREVRRSVRRGDRNVSGRFSSRHWCLNRDRDRRADLCTSEAGEISTTLDNVRLAIEDNGCGFKPEPKTMTGFGIRGMRERVMAVEGVLHLNTEPGAGCQIVVELPLDRSKE